MTIPLGHGFRIAKSRADGQVVLQEQDDRWGFWVTILKLGPVLRRAHLPELARQTRIPEPRLAEAVREATGSSRPGNGPPETKGHAYGLPTEEMF